MIKNFIKLHNLTPFTILQITSKDRSIDFAKNCIRIDVSFDNNWEYYLYAELYVYYNKYINKTVINLPVYGENAIVQIESFDSPNIEKLVVLKFVQ